jgi:hypothetical protein
LCRWKELKKAGMDVGVGVMVIVNPVDAPNISNVNLNFLSVRVVVKMRTVKQTFVLELLGFVHAPMEKMEVVVLRTEFVSPVDVPNLSNVNLNFLSVRVVVNIRTVKQIIVFPHLYLQLAGAQMEKMEVDVVLTGIVTLRGALKILDVQPKFKMVMDVLKMMIVNQVPVIGY